MSPSVAIMLGALGIWLVASGKATAWFTVLHSPTNAAPPATTSSTSNAPGISAGTPS